MWLIRVWVVRNERAASTNTHLVGNRCNYFIDILIRGWNSAVWTIHPGLHPWKVRADWAEELWALCLIWYSHQSSMITRERDGGWEAFPHYYTENLAELATNLPLQWQLLMRKKPCHRRNQDQMCSKRTQRTSLREVQPLLLARLP